MRLLIAVIALLLLLAACGGSSSTTTTPTPTQETASLTSTPVGSPSASATPGVTACTADHLKGELANVSAAAGTAYYKIIVSNTYTQACTISGPPVAAFMDTAGTGFLVDAVAGSPCGTGPIDPSLCVDNQPLELAAADQGSSAQVTATVAIANASNFDPQPTPVRQAHVILLVFEGGTAVAVPLDSDITIVASGQVSLFGYGPSS